MGETGQALERGRAGRSGRAHAGGSPRQNGLTITQAAEGCGVHRNTIRRYLDLGRFPHARRDPGSRGPWRIPKEDLVASGLHLDEHKAAARSERARARRDMHDQVEVLRERVADMTRRAEVAEALAEERAKRIVDLRQALSLLGHQPDR